jgi:hypothetical protein
MPDLEEVIHAKDLPMLDPGLPLDGLRNTKAD